MAIKISGTEVISNSRGLNNIASIDSTTAAAISAGGVGGGGGAYDFVASGAISNGDLVGLNADGTVSVVSQYLGSPAIFETGTTGFISATFDSNSNKVVIAYRDDGNSGYGTAVVGTVSGTSISFGTPVVFESATINGTSTTFDSNSNKVVIAYPDFGNSNYGTAVVGTVSGTSISFGTPVVFESAGASYVSATFDSNSNKVVIAYMDQGNSNYGTAIVGTVSGTSISFGTAVVFESATTVDNSATFDSNSNKVVIVYRDTGNFNLGTAIVGTVSGTSISFGTPAVFSSASTASQSATFDSNSNKVVIAYRDGGNSFYGTALVGTVSGTSISFGTSVVFNSASTDYNSATFDSNSNKVVIAYHDNGNSSYGTGIAGIVSGTSISFGDPVVFNSGTTDYIAATFDSNSNRVVISYRDGGNSNRGTSVAIDLSSTFLSWVGIAAENIADTATGSVNIIGGVNEGQTGLATAERYYLQDDATLSTTIVSGREIGRALSSTKLLITQGSITP